MSRLWNKVAPDSLISMEEGKKYWETVTADVNGMLGGWPSVTRLDLQGSQKFLARLGIGVKTGRKVVHRALDGGAGIGRVTKGLLLDVAEQVDIVEPVARFTAGLVGEPGVGQIFNVGLQDWQPQEGVKYDLIWMQWCVGHLPDHLLVQYLGRCGTALSPEGIIVVKENLSTAGEDWFDEVDNAVTRMDETFMAIFKDADLQVVRSELQQAFPAIEGRTLLPVKMYALKPRGSGGGRNSMHVYVDIV
ncbi:hypothetical protein F66182_6984 [Fusarium sp. NRRL 66182]|nr:hypothetical protein F66182_6984 [Fusarium sp. NRRL 66182]